PRPPRPAPFPYTTLFRSRVQRPDERDDVVVGAPRCGLGEVLGGLGDPAGRLLQVLTRGQLVEIRTWGQLVEVRTCGELVEIRTCGELVEIRTRRQLVRARTRGQLVGHGRRVQLRKVRQPGFREILGWF